VLCAAGLIFAVTRSVWLASGIATLVTLFAFRELRRYTIPVAATAAVLVVGAFAVVPGLHERAADRTQARLPIWDRVNTNMAAINMVEARPLVGFGWDRFDTVGTDYFEVLDDYPQTGEDNTVHNVFLSHAAELGLVGVTLWVLAFASGIGGAVIRRGPPELRPWRIGLLAIAVHWIVVANFVPLPYTFPNLLLWTWAGLVTAAAVRPARTALRSSPS
jgi:putative inorganic carbon (HCO3(-)) transporter